MKHILRTLALGLLLTSSAIHAADTIEARDAWVREAPPSVTVLAAYLQLVNHGAADRVLKQVTSKGFSQVEIHRTEEHGGMAHMIKIPDVAVPANGTLIFQKGGLHLMLIDPKTLLKAGDSVALTLHFADGATLEVNAPVRKADAGSHEHMHDHQHQH
jgi:hypothetical protein